MALLEAATLLSRIRLIAIGALSVASAATSPSLMAAGAEDACALLTPAQVSAAVSASVGAGTYVMPTFKKTCTWTASHAANGVRIVTVSFEGLQMYAAGKRAGASGMASGTSVSGIGDEAFYLATGNQVALHVKKGSAALKIAVYAEAPAEKVRAMEKALAQAVVAKL